MSTEKSYQALLERQKKLDAEIAGIAPSKEVVNLLASDSYKKAFGKFMRGEEITDAMKAGKAGSGGYLIPDEHEKKLIETLTEANILRQISHVIQADHDRLIPVALHGGESYFVNEGDPIPESDEEFAQVKIGAYKMATRTRVSEELLEDSVFDVEDYVITHFAERFGSLEQEAFINGDGVGKPLGLLRAAPVGAVAENSDKITIDDMLELYHSLREPYRKNAVWLMSDCIMSRIIKEYNTDGRNFWGEYAEDPTLFTLLGKPVYNCDSMPFAVTPGEKVVLFGDFSYFWIADRGRQSFKRQDELFSTTGHVGFSGSRRVDAKLIRPEAMAALQIKG